MSAEMSRHCQWCGGELVCAECAPSGEDKRIAELERQLSAALADAELLNWLETKHVAVRDPLLWGSRAMFHASPDDDDDSELSDLREQITAAIAAARAAGTYP